VRRTMVPVQRLPRRFEEGVDVGRGASGVYGDVDGFFFGEEVIEVGEEAKFCTEGRVD